MLLFFMLLKRAILCELYLLTYIICAIETPCDEVDQPFEMLRVSLVTILAREMRLKIFLSRPTFGDIASAASHDIGSRNADENLLKLTRLWRCCECR